MPIICLFPFGQNGVVLHLGRIFVGRILVEDPDLPQLIGKLLLTRTNCAQILMWVPQKQSDPFIKFSNIFSRVFAKNQFNPIPGSNRSSHLTFHLGSDLNGKLDD